MTNRLAGETSPYLLQHKDNPVDWWPWSPAAFDEARTRGVPVLLSVGYAACHWCHVMAHESFEDAATAAQMNEHFVCIKVDREERPDVDAIYMDATQALTGHGGWPMTCFLTPEGQPFYCGTYYPNRPLQGMPSFRQVLEAVSQAWVDRRDELTNAGAEVVRLLSERAVVPTEQTPPDADILEAAVASLRSDFDPAHGGFGGAPKFPPSAVLEFLIRHGSLGALEMVADTCTAMARGGMYDQLAGGFARYSVDNAWVVPHFEKMLYDNAQLVRVYAHWWRATGSPLARRIAIETAQFMMDDLRTPEGGFASALDADTNGVEGSTYVWTRGQLLDVLGVDDAQWAADLLVVTAAGTFEHGASVLQLPADPDDEGRWSRVRAALLEARRKRPQPGRDDKVVAAWNGLAIAALAEAGVLFDRSDFIDAAVDAARLLIDVHLVDGRLRRVSRDGVVGQPAGVLEDYADVAEGLLVLAQVTASRELLDQRRRAARRVSCAFCRWVRWLLRYRGRCRDVGAAATESDRRCDAGRAVGARTSVAHLRRVDRVDVASCGGRGGAWCHAGARREVSAGRRLGTRCCRRVARWSGRDRDRRRSGPGGRRDRRDGPTIGVMSDSNARPGCRRRLARSSRSARGNGGRRGRRCLRIAQRSTACRPRTSAGSSSACARSPRSATSPPL